MANEKVSPKQKLQELLTVMLEKNESAVEYQDYVKNIVEANNNWKAYTAERKNPEPDRFIHFLSEEIPEFFEVYPRSIFK